MSTLSSKRFMIFLLAFSVMAGLFLYRYAGKDSLWVDELCTVSSVRSGLSFSDTVNIYATRDNQSPLMPFIAYFWYRAVPHTEQNLRLLGILFAVLASMIVGITGKKLYGLRFGVFAFMFTICNYTVLEAAALEFRPYNLLLLVCALNYCCYLERLRRENWFTVILYGLTMGLMPYTHYVSVLFCAGLFLADCLMVAKGRAGFRVVLSYVLGALIFSPWAYVLLTRFDTNKFTAFWPKVPTLLSIAKLGKYLTGAGCSLSVMFLGAVLGFFCVIRNLYAERKEPSVESAFMSAGIFASAFMVLVVFVYSAFINPKGSCFVERYFLPTMPFVALTSAMGADFLYDSMRTVFARRAKLLFAVMFLMIAAASLGKTAKNDVHHEPYREAIGLIRRLEAGYTGNSAIVTTDNAYAYEGWREMYLASDDEFTVYPIAGENTHDELKAHMYDKIYFMFMHTKPNRRAETLKWLHEHYDFGEQENYISGGKEEDLKLQVLELRK